MLQTKKIVTAMEIADRFEISIRTVYRDIRALEEGGIPVGAEPGKGYYLVEGYHLPPVMFTAEEAGSILIAGKLANTFSDVSVRQNINLAIDKIKSVLPDSHKEFINDMERHVHVFHKPYLEKEDFSNNFIITIQKALSEKKCISMDYFSQYNNSSASRIIEPIGLCFYSFQWHLIAFCRLRNAYRDFRLDRIQRMQILDEAALNIQKMTIKQYFTDSLYQEGLFPVSVTFNRNKSALITNTRYYFGFFEEIVGSESIQMRFAINDYTYFANWLLTLGDMVIDIDSAELKNRLVSVVKNLAAKYC
jgi:predicted DNA-binding transcriptional regulator YafY